MECIKKASSTRRMVSSGMIAAVFGGVLIAAPVQAAPLTEVVQKTVSTYPEIGEASANRRAIDQELVQANGLYLPSVDIALGGGQEWTDTVVIDEEWNTRLESSFSVVETLFDGGFRSSEVARQESRINGAAYRVRERAEAIGLDVVRAYLDVLRNLEVVDLAASNLETHKRTLQEVQDRVSAGQSGVGDVQQTQSRVAAAEDSLIQTLRQLDESEIAYRRLVGESPINLEKPAFDDGTLPGGVEDVVAIAQDTNPDIRFAAADVTTSAAEVDQSQANYYPTINLEVEGSANHDLDGTSGHNNDFLVMLRMTYNLYRGGIDRFSLCLYGMEV